MSTHNHFEKDPRFVAYALGEMSSPERLQFEEEVLTEVAAREFLESLQKTLLDLRLSLKSEKEYSLNVSQKKALDLHTESRIGWKFFETLRWQPILGTCVVLILFSVFYPKTTQPVLEVDSPSYSELREKTFSAKKESIEAKNDKSRGDSLASPPSEMIAKAKIEDSRADGEFLTDRKGMAGGGSLAGRGALQKNVVGFGSVSMLPKSLLQKYQSFHRSESLKDAEVSLNALLSQSKYLSLRAPTLVVLKASGRKIFAVLWFEEAGFRMEFHKSHRQLLAVRGKMDENDDMFLQSVLGFFSATTQFETMGTSKYLEALQSLSGETLKLNSSEGDEYKMRGEWNNFLKSLKWRNE